MLLIELRSLPFAQRLPAFNTRFTATLSTMNTLFTTLFYILGLERMVYDIICLERFGIQPVHFLATFLACEVALTVYAVPFIIFFYSIRACVTRSMVCLLLHLISAAADDLHIGRPQGPSGRHRPCPTCRIYQPSLLLRRYGHYLACELR